MAAEGSVKAEIQHLNLEVTRLTRANDAHVKRMAEMQQEIDALKRLVVEKLDRG
jgi:hypothetical protein